MKMLQNLRGRRLHAQAFTIADVVVAVLVLGVVGSAFCSALSSGFAVLQTTREDLRATQILMQKVEAMRLCTWSELTNFTFVENYDPLSRTNQTGTLYYGTVAVGSATSIPNSASYAANMALVTINLNWTNSLRGVPMPHNRKMQTQVARYGLQNYVWGAIK